MGNTLLDESRKEDPVEIFEQWLEQNPDLVGREVLTHNKLFESNCFKYCERSIKLAVFFCRDDTQLSEHLQVLFKRDRSSDAYWHLFGSTDACICCQCDFFPCVSSIAKKCDINKTWSWLFVSSHMQLLNRDLKHDPLQVRSKNVTKFLCSVADISDGLYSLHGP